MAEPWIVSLDLTQPEKVIVAHTNQNTRWHLRISNWGPSDVNLGGLEPLGPGFTVVSDADTGFSVSLVRLGTDPKPSAIVQIEVLGTRAV